jgi:hypothetical protein
MKISTILDYIDSGHMALPEFQRGYVWNRDQVRGLFDSLYRRHPVGGLLVWATEAKTAAHRGDGALAAGVVKLLLDGQQRMTSLYGVVRGRAPKFFDGNTRAFTGLRFHLETETFEFYQPVKMKGDPLWTDVTELMQKGIAGLGEFVTRTRLTEQPALAPKVGDYVGRLSQLLGIVEVDLHVEEVTGADKSLDVVVNIYFPKLEARRPGGLASKWIPMDPVLWKMERFGTSSKPGRSCWRRSSTGVWRICCTATPGGSRVRRRSRLCRPVSLAASRARRKRHSWNR